MKKRLSNSKSLLLSLLLIVTVSFSLTAQDAVKEFTKVFDVGEGITLSSITKYSDVELITWDQNKIDILAVVEVDASSKSKAEEKLAKIDVKMTKSGNTVSLETSFKEGWSKNVKEKLAKRPERKKEFVNTSGIPIKRLYTPLDNKQMDYLPDLGFPGEYQLGKKWL